MGDVMRPIPFAQLMNWILEEYNTKGSIFGVSKLPRCRAGEARPIFAERLEAPFGPAAGPHTQLAQNIIAAYAAGARFFELKTVQVMDGEELSKCVAKPCITAGDECYNCEWSTELTVPQAFNEYVKAWVACKLLARELALGDPDGFVFNMSVGYDLAGIQTPKIDTYIEGMKNAAQTPVWQECIDWAGQNLSRFERVDGAFVAALSPVVSGSITLSTLHGCPPDEIERIAAYLITEKKLNTYVKCNPTLLGYDFARETLDALGFDYVAFDDHHFQEDLQFGDAVPMIGRLMDLARAGGLEFGVKLTNTFPVQVAAGELPSEEMYMSGRALYPLTIALAARLTAAFSGALRISYSGGAELHNIKDLVEAGIWPVTMATTLLKPGGYQRMFQMAGALAGGGAAFSGVNAQKVAALAARAREEDYYRKPMKLPPSRKLKAKVPLVDCFTAPCRGGCPIGQDVPAYLRLAGEGRYEQALATILERNPLPFITGTICAHPCMEKCTRSFYEGPVRIRAVKREAAERAFSALLPKVKPKPATGAARVAVVGGGPAGLAAAYFLGREGVPVTVFERADTLGGLVSQVIPAFRIPAAVVANDIALVRAMGAEFRMGCEVRSADELKAQGFTHVLFATGAWAPGRLPLEYGEAINVLDFLQRAKQAPETLNLGADVAVIGGGNSAMDAARAAKRIPGVERVRLVYRRTRRYMPADEEELVLAMEDGVAFCELLAPVGVRDGLLTCKVMALGAPDASGRRSPVETGETVTLPATSVIAAVGERIDEGVDVSGDQVYLIGDRRNGPSTVVQAIADAAEAVQSICGAGFARFEALNLNPQGDGAPRGKKGTVCAGGVALSEAERCLECPTVCECCVDVCPNRANVTVAVAGLAMRQIVHVDGMCNECGNCTVFCPYDSSPYREKLTLFWSEADFENSENEGWLPQGDGSGLCRVRLDGQEGTFDALDPSCGLPETIRGIILAVRESYGYLVGAAAGAGE